MKRFALAAKAGMREWQLTEGSVIRSMTWFDQKQFANSAILSM